MIRYTSEPFVTAVCKNGRMKFWTGIRETCFQDWPDTRGGRPGQIMSLSPQNRCYLNFSGLGQGWRTFSRARAQTADYFRINYFTSGRLSLIAPYFPLKQ